MKSAPARMSSGQTFLPLKLRNPTRNQLPALALDPRQNVHQFRDFDPAISRIAALDGVLDAVRDVVAQDLFLGPAQCGAHSRNLRHDVDTVAAFLDHSRNSAHLTFYSVQPLQARGFGFVLHH